MEFVYKSRWLQEQTLAKTIKDPVLKEKIMTKEEVYRFVMHYERLTHYILEEIPKFLKNDNWAENWVIRVRSARESGYNEISMR